MQGVLDYAIWSELQGTMCARGAEDCGARWTATRATTTTDNVEPPMCIAFRNDRKRFEYVAYGRAGCDERSGISMSPALW